MSTSVKKNSLSFYLRAFTCILGIAGLIAMVISSTMSSANKLFGLPLLIVLAVAGVALIALSVLVFPRQKLGEYLTAASVVGTIALFTAVIGNVINSRILLVSGLFSFNAGNTVGWSVFYVTVASLACFLVAILVLIISSFMKSTK